MVIDHHDSDTEADSALLMLMTMFNDNIIILSLNDIALKFWIYHRPCQILPPDEDDSDSDEDEDDGGEDHDDSDDSDEGDDGEDDDDDQRWSGGGLISQPDRICWHSNNSLLHCSPYFIYSHPFIYMLLYV